MLNTITPGSASLTSTRIEASSNRSMTTIGGCGRPQGLAASSPTMRATSSAICMLPSRASWRGPHCAQRKRQRSGVYYPAHLRPGMRSRRATAIAGHFSGSRASRMPRKPIGCSVITTRRLRACPAAVASVAIWCRPPYPWTASLDARTPRASMYGLCLSAFVVGRGLGIHALRRRYRLVRRTQRRPHSLSYRPPPAPVVPAGEHAVAPLHDRAVGGGRAEARDIVEFVEEPGRAGAAG